MSSGRKKIPLFNEYEAYTPEAYVLADEVVKALRPILDKYSANHTLREIESVVLGSAAVITSEQILRAALLRHDVEEAEEEHAGVEHVRRAFDLLGTMSDVDRGIAQHTLLVALQEPGVASDEYLPEALFFLPDILRGVPAPVPSGPITDLVGKLVEVAKRDQRFLDNFLAGNPAASFI